MEFFWPIIILIAIVSVAFSIFSAVATTNLRSNEASNVDEISRLRSQVSAKRDKVQEIRLGNYQPTNTEKTRYRQKSPASTENKNLVMCFYCDESIEHDALVCRHCTRPVFENTSKFKERILSKGSKP